MAESDASFPSGHATDSAALFIALGIICAAVVVDGRRRRVICVGFGIAIPFLIGASRLVLGVHWPTDVITGWILGAASAVVVSTVALRVFPPHTLGSPAAEAPSEHRDSTLAG